MRERNDKGGNGTRKIPARYKGAYKITATSKKAGAEKMRHTGLIYTIARRYLSLCDSATNLDDLMQAGHIGLMRA